MKIVLIGAGNLATQVALTLKEKGLEIVQIFSRTEQSAQLLAKQIGCCFTTNSALLYPDADVYLYAVSDDILPGVIANISINKGLHAHTAGSIPMLIFEAARSNYGVFYPLQTFSKNKRVDFNKIPIFIEANSDKNLETLRQLGEILSQTVVEANSTQRQALHLAAVFASNFTNHLYAVADKILKKNKLDFRLMLPLLYETLDKLHTLTPAEAQTGPAVRGDRSVINKHLAALTDFPEEKKLYEVLSAAIANTAQTSHNK
ncbi:MAG: DUF2520 domain-containing protein [Prevotellaceae bacterium]|jgi:predicted short-subunit dehydrogenase-like oxidoreductase (DUF2520 family)|nr:DUF2520 domain-containing protein [Prevotellaceae bacterium]